MQNNFGIVHTLSLQLEETGKTITYMCDIARGPPLGDVMSQVTPGQDYRSRSIFPFVVYFNKREDGVVVVDLEEDLEAENDIEVSS